jgi:hypothetical protein
MKIEDNDPNEKIITEGILDDDRRECDLYVWRLSKNLS